jgi:hypothetical protein
LLDKSVSKPGDFMLQTFIMGSLLSFAGFSAMAEMHKTTNVNFNELINEDSLEAKNLNKNLAEFYNAKTSEQVASKHKQSTLAEKEVVDDFVDLEVHWRKGSHLLGQSPPSHIHDGSDVNN